MISSCGRGIARKTQGTTSEDMEAKRKSSKERENRRLKIRGGGTHPIMSRHIIHRMMYEHVTYSLWLKACG